MTAQCPWPDSRRANASVPTPSSRAWAPAAWAWCSRRGTTRLERDVAIKVLHPEMAGIPTASVACWRKAEPRARSTIPISFASTTPLSRAAGTTSYRMARRQLAQRRTVARPAAAETPARPCGADRRWPCRGACMGIVHRDIKPENVMLARDGTARDCRLRAGAYRPAFAGMWPWSPRPHRDGIEGGLSGTPAYMSPEQARGTAGDFRHRSVFVWRAAL